MNLGGQPRRIVGLGVYLEGIMKFATIDFQDDENRLHLLFFLPKTLFAFESIFASCAFDMRPALTAWDARAFAFAA